MPNADNLVVPQLARMYLAPVGTTAPETPVSAMPAEWRDVGYFTADSLQFATEPAFEEATAHQSAYAVRSWQTSMAASAQVNLMEWSGENFQAVFGGGTIEEITVTGPPAYTYYKFTPPGIGERRPFAAVIEIIDGDKHYRRIIPKCEQNEGVEQSMDRTAQSTLPLRLKVLGSDVAPPFYDVTDDPSFAPA